MLDVNKVIDPQEADVICPQCEHSVLENLGRLRADPNVTCPACHSIISLDLRQFEARLTEAQNKLNELDTSVPKAIKLNF
jgi:hypothetical protein